MWLAFFLKIAFFIAMFKAVQNSNPSSTPMLFLKVSCIPSNITIEISYYDFEKANVEVIFLVIIWN